MNPTEQAQYEFMVAKQASDLRFCACDLLIKSGAKYSETEKFVSDAKLVYEFLSGSEPKTNKLVRV